MNVFPERVTDDKGSAKIEGGITLRDYYAAAALTGILSNPNTPANTPFYVAEDAYRLADAMLEMRSQ
jgi:hypothetical protein